MSKTFSKRKKELVFNKTDGKCSVCGEELTLDFFNEEIKFMQIDHLIPKKLGGKNNIENLFPLCRSCNSAKRDYTVFDLLIQIKEIENNAKIVIRKKKKIIDYIERYKNGN